MGLKLIEKYKNVDIEYHKIISITPNKQTNRIVMQIGKYKDKESSDLAGNNTLSIDTISKPLSLVKDWNKDIFAIGYELLKESSKLQMYEEDNLTPIGKPVEKNKYALAEDC